VGRTSFGIKSVPVDFREAIDTKDVDCTKVIAIDEKGRILTLVTADGISLPCDFLDMDDRDALDAAHRVAWEVACVTLGTLILLNTIDVIDATGRKHRTLVVAARIARQDPMRTRFARLFLEPEEFLIHYRTEIETVQNSVKAAIEGIPEFNPNHPLSKASLKWMGA
jgi:hypothetical protein